MFSYVIQELKKRVVPIPENIRAYPLAEYHYADKQHRKAGKRYYILKNYPARNAAAFAAYDLSHLLTS